MLFIDSHTKSPLNVNDVIDNPAYNQLQISYYRGLVLNKNFINLCKQIRQERDIPAQGYDWKDHLDSGSNGKNKKVFLDYQRVVNSLNDANITLFTYNDNFATRSDIQTNIARLVLANYVLIREHRDIGISVHRSDDGGNEPYDDSIHLELDIVIRRRVSKRELIRFIEDEKNWEKIESAFEEMPEKRQFEISDRDLKIVEMRDLKKMKFKDICDALAEDKYHYNTEMIQMAYKRAKTKIKKLIKI